MKDALYHIFHVGSLLLLVGAIGFAFAKPSPERKKMIMMITGVSSLIMLITGFGMVAVMKLTFETWLIVKLVCWLGLGAIVGFGFRKPDKVPALIGITVLLVLVGVAMVYLRDMGYE